VLAVDTNVIARYLTGDEAEPFAKASALIRDEDVYVCTTVLRETEWVLRRGYRLGRERILAIRLCRSAACSHEDSASAPTALNWTRRGVDLADALYLARAQGGEAFVSFDRRFAAVAQCPKRGEGPRALPDRKDWSCGCWVLPDAANRFRKTI
jgi:predicted nucleic acid-binding protein